MIGSIARLPLWMRAWVLPVLDLGLVLGGATIVWLGHTATEEWRRSTVLLIQRAREEQLEVAHTSVIRDMRGVQAAILTVTSEELLEPAQNALLQTCARIFANYPYPESLFCWRRKADGLPETHVFSRSSRMPGWFIDSAPRTPFPVVRRADGGELKRVVDTVLDYAETRRHLAAFETSIDGTAYQIVSRLDYERPGSNIVSAALGFMVNLDWARRRYFPELVEQISQLGPTSGVMPLAIIDEAGAMVGAARNDQDNRITLGTEFPLLFLDPDLLPLHPPPELPVRRWRVGLTAVDDESLRSVLAGANRTFALICLAVATIVGGLGLTIRSVIAGARLAALKSDLLSALTHELKTPISSIQLASQTLAQGRYTQEETVRRYAGLLFRESSRLNRLVTNLLMFARLTDVRPKYILEDVQLGDVIEDALESLQSQLEERKAAITVEVPADLPTVRAERAGMLRVFENVLDNAIRYSAADPVVSVICRTTLREVHVCVRDNGPGIADQDILRVFEKFARGSHPLAEGTGLGLAVARRIVEDHGGRIELRSTLGEGTQVLISLPATAEEQA